MIILLLGVSLSLQSVFPTFFSIVFNCCIHLFHGHLCMSILLDCNLLSNAVMRPVQKLIELKTAVLSKMAPVHFSVCVASDSHIYFWLDLAKTVNTFEAAMTRMTQHHQYRS